MTVANPQVQIDPFPAVRQRIQLLVDEVAGLVEGSPPQADFFASFLQRVLAGLTAPAGAVWMVAPSGLHLQCQINAAQCAVPENETDRRGHQELLRRVAEHGRPWHLPPRTTMVVSGEEVSADNPTDSDLLIVPIRSEGRVAGLIEVWQQSGLDPAATPGFLQFLGQMADLAGNYLRNCQIRDLAGRQQLWERLETFARQVHQSLNPIEVSYLVANEGRRLIECDRLSVGIRRGRKVAIEAVSGVDVAEKRSNSVRLMRSLVECVLRWGEKLVYVGAVDDGLPIKVKSALDAYLAVCPCRLLAILPLRDDRENARKLPRSVLLLECFGAPSNADQIVARLATVGSHAASALYNAAEYRRIPGRWLWRPLGRLQEGIGGKSRIRALAFLLIAGSLAAALTWVPFPLRVDARGQLLPSVRRLVYSPVEGQVVRFEDGVQPGSLVAEGQSLVLLYDVNLEVRLVQLSNEIAAAQRAIEALTREETTAATEGDRQQFGAERRQKEFLRDRKDQERQALRERARADDVRPGYFWLKAPVAGTILNGDFREALTNRQVKPSEPLLRIGDKAGPWNVELRLPQRFLGHLQTAWEADPAVELDVDLVLLSAPTRTFKGKLDRRRVATLAGSNRDDQANPEPVVLVTVRVEGSALGEAQAIPTDLLVTGTEVHARVRCGEYAMGYSLFHGVWEFLCERVLFSF